MDSFIHIPHMRCFVNMKCVSRVVPFGDFAAKVYFMDGQEPLELIDMNPDEFFELVKTK